MVRRTPKERAGPDGPSRGGAPAETGGATSLAGLAEHAVGAVHLAVDRALAHAARPADHPLPEEPLALERLAHQQLARLSEPAAQGAATAALARLGAGEAARRAHYGRFAELDPRSARPALSDARRLAGCTRSPRARRTEPIDDVLGDRLPLEPAPPSDGPRPEVLRLRLKNVHCEQDTTERFRDEIAVAGVSVDLCAGTSAVLPTVALGKFRAGDRRSLSPMPLLTRFPLAAGAEAVPYVATLVLAEQDWGGLDRYLADLHVVHDVGLVGGVLSGAITVALREADPSLLASIGIGAAVAVLAPLLAPLLVVALVGRLVGAALDWRRDEIFNEAPLFQAVGPFGARFAGRPPGSTSSADGIADFRGPTGPGGFGGRYRLNYDWVVAPA